MKYLKDNPQHGDERTVTQLLFLPTTVYYKDRQEKRWLEFATIKQVYVGSKWENICFIDE